MDAEVIVVGAGLAGLRCAGVLAEAGLEVLVLEAGDAPGGRIRTDRVDGFLVDRGFQVLNPAYPAVRRWVDVEALRLQSFAAGVAAVTDRGRTVLGHPLRAPRLLAPTVRTALGDAKDAAALLRWAGPLLRPRRDTPLSQVVAGRDDVDRATALDRRGVNGVMRRILDGFLAGVVLEDDGTTADRYVLLLAWMFARGVPSLPVRGMQALPDQLAGPLGDRVRVAQRVTSVDGTSAHTDDRRGPRTGSSWPPGPVRRTGSPEYRCPPPRASPPSGGLHLRPRTAHCCTSTRAVARPARWSTPR